jgi:uncharacterized protein YfaS (alpha-2-macroglobulin family)
LQNYDGGFPYWRRGQDSIPFHTIHVAHALQRAELKGFTVPREMQQSALDYLRLIENYYPSCTASASPHPFGLRPVRPRPDGRFRPR